MARPEPDAQDSLDKVRKPRVQITYQVQIGNAKEKKELPFRVGVLVDFTGQPKESPRPLAERQFLDISRDNFDAVTWQC
jgi:type VI secretion system protein ImpB